MCGVIPGDIDDLTHREVRFHIGKIRSRKLGGGDEMSNLDILCSTCYQGTKELMKERMSAGRGIARPRM